MAYPIDCHEEVNVQHHNVSIHRIILCEGLEWGKRLTNPTIPKPPKLLKVDGYLSRHANCRDYPTLCM